MQHIYVNFKRFDVPAELGGVNRISAIADYASTIIGRCAPALSSYSDAEFVHFYPEAQLPSAVKASEGTVIQIGSQGVYREDIVPGGAFGAFTSNRPAAAVRALGCSHTLIGHLEERNDKLGILKAGGCEEFSVVNDILNQEVLSAQKRDLSVLYCVGERDYEMDIWDKVIRTQLERGLKGADLSRVVIAYEPVWSIGPGKTPAGREYIIKVARLIKQVLGADMPVVYGGGLKKDNAQMLSSIEEIDGGLIALTRFSGEIGFYPEEYLEIVSLYLGGKEKKR